MKKIILIVFAFCSTALQAQTSVMQDGNGETSFQTTKNLIAINAANSSILFSVTPASAGNLDFNFTGAFEAKEGTTKLFSSGKLQFNGKAGIQFVKHNKIQGPNDTTGKKVTRFFGGFEVLYSKINVYDSTRVFDSQISNQNNIGFKINGGYLSYDDLPWGFVFGGTLSGGIHDNSDNLEQSEIITASTVQTEGTQTRMHATTEDVYVSGQIKRSNKFGRINADLGHHFLDKRFFVNLHCTYAVEQDIKPKTNAALGLFVLQKAAPMEAVVGIQIQSNDLFDTANTGFAIDKRTSLVLTVGFPFDLD